MNGVIDEINKGNGVGSSSHSHNVAKRLFLEMFHLLELEVSDEISRFTGLPHQKPRLNELPTKQSSFTQLPTQESCFSTLDRELKEIYDVFGNDYQVNDMVVDGNVKVDENHNMNDMVFNASVRVEENHDVNYKVVNAYVTVEESHNEVKDMVVDDSVSDEEHSKSESRDDVFVDEDNIVDEYHVDVTLFGLIDNETQDVLGFSDQVPDSMFGENNLDVIDNEELNTDYGEEDELERIRNRKLKQLKKENRKMMV
ncbi:hypothetical protein Tco_0223231 [Tanacetum coccineum]